MRFKFVLIAAVCLLVPGAHAEPTRAPAFVSGVGSLRLLDKVLFQNRAKLSCSQTPTVRATCGRGLTGLTMTAEVDDDVRLLGSRRLAAASKVINNGVDDMEAKKLLGSKRLREAAKVVITTPRDAKRTLGSRRLKEARQILFNKAAQTNSATTQEKRLFGSKRLNNVRNVLVRGATEVEVKSVGMESAVTKEVHVTAQAPAVEEKAAAVQHKSEPEPSTVAVEVKKTGNVFEYGQQTVTDKQVADIAKVRSYLAALTDEDKEDFSPWIDHLQDVDIYRYLLGFGDADSAWEKIKGTAEWRKSENIDSILSEDMGDIFEEGKEEMFYLPPDKKGRPMLLYRSALHKPGDIDPEVYTRYVIQQTERAMVQYGIGRKTESVVIVDRIGSGLKNQDPALLRVLIPVILNHYPYMVGAVYVAPTSGVFNVIWGVLKLLLDADAQKRFILINKKVLTDTLHDVVDDELLPTNLGGSLDVSQWLIERKDLDKASAQLSELELLMSGVAEEAEREAEVVIGAVGSSSVKKVLAWGGKEASEQELLIIGSIRVNIAELSGEQKEELGPWITQLDNVDILRFLRRDRTLERTWAALQSTSKWRKEERIDDILSETIDIMPEGKEEFYYTGMDNKKRPVLVYRAVAHTPGRVDPEIYNRYVIKTLEQGRKDFGLGISCQAAVVVDRIGSGLKNQDPALLRVLLPCFTTHFPGVVGNIYIAPVNSVFYAIWSLVSILLDQETRESVKLLSKTTKTEELLKEMPPSSLPINLGGAKAVPEAGIV
jgi:hypothetical protein